jgi:hypothetical protein
MQNKTRTATIPKFLTGQLMGYTVKEYYALYCTTMQPIFIKYLNIIHINYLTGFVGLKNM